MPFRVRYWSCSSFADFVRGTEKPQAMGNGEWAAWEEKAKTTHPIRYWIAEVLFDKVQDTLNWPRDKFRDMRYWLHNRFSSQSHALVSHKLKKGKWYDYDDRILYCMFDELVNFVEQQQAWMQVMSENRTGKRSRRSFFMWGWRDAEAGLRHLDWASKLVYDESWGTDPSAEHYGELTGQAKAAIEIRELYTWWKEVYPNRSDPYEVSSWRETTDALDEKYGGFLSSLNKGVRTSEEDEAVSKARQSLSDIENEYDREEEEMLIRLIKIRKHLWT